MTIRKIKSFANDSSVNRLDTAINQWLSDNPEIEIISHLHSSNRYYWTTQFLYTEPEPLSEASKQLNNLTE